MDRAAKLRAFFAEGVNSVTRERVFFHRLAFDLKIAAARLGYHLYIHEPDVDRDGFDIVVEDDDSGVGWLQTKAALSSAATASWEVVVDFLRPDLESAEAYRFDPPEAGRGGGVIVIEIADDTDSVDVTYRYTDVHILAAIASGFLQEVPWDGRGRRSAAAQAEAEDLMLALKKRGRKERLNVPKQVFVTVRGPDELLGLTGMRTDTGYGMWTVKRAYGEVRVDAAGRWCKDERLIQDAAAVSHHMGLLAAAQPPATQRKITRFKPFDFP